MAAGDFFQNLKGKMQNIYNGFFYDGEEAPARESQQEEAAEPMQETGFQQPVNYQQPVGYQQPVNYQQPAGYQQPVNYQQPVGYQQPVNYQQPAPYQQPAAPAGYAAPQAEAPRQGGRARRMNQRAQSNVVDFGAYQAYQAATPVEEAPVQQSAAPAALPGTRVINARGMGDCRSAITLLREGDAVLIVLENITDPAEMRRLVDTLSGACYSLTATITKVSRGGVYLLAPQEMAVYTDQITSQMNSIANHTYSAQQPQQPQQPAAAMPEQVPQGFAQRTAAPAAAAPSFYARSVPQNTAAPSFSARQPSGGYRPDEMAAGAY